MPGRRVELPVNNSRHGCTLFGAFGSPLAHPCFRLAKSTNKQSFKQFLMQVAGSFKNPIGGRPLLILDNHSSHRSSDCRALMNQHFETCF